MARSCIKELIVGSPTYHALFLILHNSSTMVIIFTKLFGQTPQFLTDMASFHCLRLKNDISHNKVYRKQSVLDLSHDSTKNGP